MTKELKRISLEEFVDNSAHILEQVIHEHKAILVENEYGELVEVKPVTQPSALRRDKDKEDQEAFLNSAGAWADFDLDAFLKANEESRMLATRPRIKL